MQNLNFTLLVVLFLTGCSLAQRRSHEGPARSDQRSEKNNIAEKSFAVWELHSLKKLQLQFKNVDNGSNLSIIIEKGLTQKKIPTGHWELTGFEQNGISYLPMITTKKFVFKINSGTHVYAGSVVVGCPKIAAIDFKLLKGMSFFNRYPFSSKAGLCEFVIGNNFEQVRTELHKAQESKKLNLVLGF
jgi:hypothetical protein